MLEPRGIPEYETLPETDLSKNMAYTMQPLIQYYNNLETGIVEVREAGRVRFVIEGKREIVGPILDAAFEKIRELRE